MAEGGRLVLLGRRGGSLPAARKEVRRIAKRFDAVNSVTFSHDGRFLLTGNVSVGTSDSSGEPSFTGVAHLWDIRTMELVRSFGTEPVVYAAFSAGDKYILTATG